MNTFRHHVFPILKGLLGLIGAMIIGYFSIIGGAVINSAAEIGLLPLEWVIAVPYIFIIGGLTGVITFALHLVQKKRKLNWVVSFLVIAVIYYAVSLAVYQPFLWVANILYSYSLVATGSITSMVVFGTYWLNKNNKLKWAYSYLLIAIINFTVGLFLFKVEASF